MVFEQRYTLRRRQSVHCLTRDIRLGLSRSGVASSLRLRGTN